MSSGDHSDVWANHIISPKSQIASQVHHMHKIWVLLCICKLLGKLGFRHFCTNHPIFQMSLNGPQLVQNPKTGSSAHQHRIDKPGFSYFCTNSLIPQSHSQFHSCHQTQNMDLLCQQSKFRQNHGLSYFCVGSLFSPMSFIVPVVSHHQKLGPLLIQTNSGKPQPLLFCDKMVLG